MHLARPALRPRERRPTRPTLFLLFVLLGLLGLFAAAPIASARIEPLLVPPAEPADPKTGPVLVLYLNNPGEHADRMYLPARLPADFACGTVHDRTYFEVIEPLPADRVVAVPARQFARYTLRLAAPLAGTGTVASLRLAQPATNAVMFALTAQPSPTPPPPAPGMPPPSRSWFVGDHLDLSGDLEQTRRYLSAYDPIYFAVGSRDRLNARFQFSFKFRFFADRGPDYPEPFWKRRVRELHFAYTQTSIWDLESFSKPFYDSSYQPTLFLLQRLPTFHRDVQISLQSGGQHESNGKGGAAAPAVPAGALSSGTNRVKHPFDTRSFNTLYVRPRIRWERRDSGLFLEAAARLSGYFQHDENDDIEQYRGNVELTLRGGLDRGAQLSLHLRGRPGRPGSAEFNFTWPANQTPLLRHVAPTLGGYAQIQYFNGYGESLLDYDVRRRDQLRFGLMLVR